MKLTKKQEKEILQVYNAYWGNYLKGDVEAIHPSLADEYTQVGSAEGEVFSNKKDAVQFLYDTIDEVAGKLEMRNRNTIVEQQENTILIHELCDLYALADDTWIFYSKFRVSTWMHLKKEGWKITHQHSSFPDTKAEDGRNIAIDKIAEENQQLREAVKRRTVELENKNRELEIETALEKVRTVAMGMRKADDMLKICKTISQQLFNLGVTEIRNVQTAIIYQDKGTYMNFEFYVKHDKLLATEVLYSNHPMSKAFVKKMLSGPNEFFKRSLKGKKVKEWYAFQTTTNQFADKYLAKATSLNYYWYSLGPVALGASTYEPLSKEEQDLLIRFRNVFELSYRRYLDIEKAEAQAREAQIEAALERMRSVAMSIRKSEEMIQVATSLYNELKGLGITNIRNAQVVIKVAGDEMYLVCVYADDTSEVFKESRYDTAPITQQMYDELESSSEALYQKEISGKEFEQWLKWREDTGAKINRKLLEARSVTFCLYSIGEGHLGISAYNHVTDEQLSVLKRFRNVFELSYRRFMDVAKSEEQALKLQQEKERLEFALNELQTTQKQLIQAEKMASLGELTAGIAHEIQNPLNFVNNFSEVSNELMDEMNAEIEKGDFEEAKLIAIDIKQNLEKINHHGKRADAIVKNMLQHSRSSSGVKETTDINALADEYLRLAYHGLRAKDKSFNAIMKSDFDKSIGNINIIPQDIGRVILNLITNAFYAASLPPEGGFLDPNYKHSPTVWIKTSRNPPSGGRGAEVLISVKDNGPGIPQKVLDKIFQPFFTTKPTGKGTGLGLSMSYDIVTKGHGGELKVETKEGEGAEFIIILPV